jgi:hypothetical protein
MRRLLVVGLFVLIGVGPATVDLLACGDKFLVISRGTRFQRARIAGRQAAVLVYVNPGSTLGKALGNVPVDDSLKKAGYRGASVATTTDLGRAISQGGWDLVIADLDDSPGIRGQLPQGPTSPMVLPIAYNPTKAAFAQAKKEYPRVIKGPIKSQAFLDALDDAVAYIDKQRSQAKKTD